METIDDKLNESKVLVRVLAKSLKQMKEMASQRQDTNVPQVLDNLMHTYEETLTRAASLFYSQGYITEKQNEQVWRIVEKIWSDYQQGENKKVA